MKAMHCCLASAGMALNAGALAQGLPEAPQGTHDWGCEVLLCLANPAGPEAVAPCVPPIERLWSELAKGHAFPTCALARGPEGRSYAQMSSRAYDPCPIGTTALGMGEQAVLAAPMPPGSVPRAPSGASATYTSGSVGTMYFGIGDGVGFGQWTPDGGAPPSKVCVANPAGTQMVPSGDGGFLPVSAYGTVFTADSAGMRPVIDVYIDDRWWQSVRW